MNIGEEKRTIIVKPAQNPVPQREPAPAPERKRVPSRRPEKAPARRVPAKR